MRRAAGLALALSVLPACSAIVHVTPGQCPTSDYCNALNTRDHYDATSACFLWQCDRPSPTSLGICVRRTRDWDDDGEIASQCGGTDCDDTTDLRGLHVAEVCDAIDNDCDHVVDDGVFEAAEIARQPVGAARVAWSEPVAVAIPSDTTMSASSVALPPASFGTPAAIRYRVQTSGGTPSIGCLIGATPSCDLAEAALAPRGSAAPLALAISHSGCAEGGLRFGTLAGDTLTIAGRSTSPLASESNVYPVVDGSGSACTGTGATRPALALLPGQAYGLATWIEGSSTSRGCPGASADVRALAFLTLDRFVGATPIDFVVGSDGGVPTSLGATPMNGAPAIVPVGTLGWLVAFGGPTSVEVHFIAALTASTDPNQDPVFTFPTTSAVGTTGGVAHYVALAVADVGTGHEVALAWSEGCDANAGLFFTSFTFDAAHPASTLGTPLPIGTGTAPSVAAAASFFSPDDPDAATRGPSWLVAATAAEGIVLARVSGGALLEPAHVASAGASDAALLTVGDGSVELFGRAGGDLVRARAVCP